MIALFLHLKLLNLKRFKKILLWFFLSLLFLIVATYIFIQTPFGQNWIAGQVTKRLSKDLQTKVSIDHVSFSLFNQMHLEGVLVEDRQRDTVLYAGVVNVRITDWFFFKKEAELKYIGLENAVIKFQRPTDSIWRQQFIFDYFAPPASNAAPKKKAGIIFDLKVVELKNVTFIKRDAWLGEDMKIHVGAMSMDANDLSLSGNKYDIKSLILKNPIFEQYSYIKKKPIDPNAIEEDEDEVGDSVRSWNAGGMEFKIGELNIENGRYRADKQTDRQPYAYFDGQHLDFSEINASLTGATFIGDTVYSRLKISAKERSGFEVKNLSANMKMMPKGMEFANLDLRTNRSIIKDYFMMSYNDIGDMSSFIRKVRMTANFAGSYIDSDDLAFFSPSMASWNKTILLKGKVRGTVDDLVGRDMIVQAGNSTILNGDITLTGLPDINQTFIDFKANEFRTTYAEATTFIPALRKITSPDLRKLNYVYFTGSFTGFIRDFVTYGTIQTNLGTVKSDLNMKLPTGQPPVYSGTISTDNFQLGTFLGTTDIGAISMEGTVKGRGFVDKNRNIELKGKIRYVDFNKYRYQNIVIEQGRLQQNQFDGAIAMNDENAEFTLNGLIDFNADRPAFNFVADVKKANLKNLNLTRDDLAFNGKFNLNFEGDNIDNFLGTARISEARLQKDGVDLPFDSLYISSNYTDSSKTLTASSNEFVATINGDFNIAELPDAVQLFLNKYYPAYVKPPRRMPVNESFHFDFLTRQVEDYIKLIDSNLVGFNNSHIFGDLDLKQNKLNIDADVPYFKYGKYDFSNVKLQALGDLDSLLLTGEASYIHINDSLNVPLTTFSIRSSNDVSKVSINTGANQTINKARLNALVHTYNDGVKIEFEPSDFVVNGKTWSIDENGELQFRSNTPASGLLVLREGDQEITVRTVPTTKPDGKWNDLIVNLRKINVGDFAPLFMPGNRLEGLISGDIKVEDPTGSLMVNSDNIKAEYFRLDDDSLGEVNTTLAYDGKTKQLKINGSTANQENNLQFKADLFFEKGQGKNNVIALTPRNFQLSVLERFLGNLFSDIQGYLTGAFELRGEFNELGIVGKGRMKDAGLKINFTQCFYKIEDADLEMKENEISLDGLVLRDPVTNNPIYVEGLIEHESFKNMFYKIDVSTQKKGTTINNPVLLLNTGYNDNQQFYGRVIGTGSFTLTGPQSEMFMGISAVASETDSSSITIPPSRSRESGIADFLVERKYGREMSDSGLLSQSSNIIYDVDVTANRMLSVKVVLDELTADEIKGKGRGRLNIHSGTSEPLKIRGRYDIEEGSYLYSFQSVFKKPFELRKGADNYIEWQDDPYKAEIHFDAMYTADDVNFAPLANSLVNPTTNLSRARGDVYVVVVLTGELFRPTINFKIDFPANSVAITDPGLSFSLQQLQQNTNEVYKQVTYLIVFNSFAPPEGSGSSGTGFGDIATNTISGIFLGVINEQLNKILGKLLKNEKYSINLNTSLYNRNIIDANNKTAFNLGSNVNFSIGRSFFNDRFIITAGGGFDAPLQQSSIQQSIQLLPDVTMEWLINPSGTIRASFFYRENADYLTSTSSGGPGRARRYGGSLNYKKEFNKLGDLFRRRSKIPAPPLNDTLPPAVSDANLPVEEKKKGN